MARARTSEAAREIPATDDETLSAVRQMMEAVAQPEETGRAPEPPVEVMRRAETENEAQYPVSPAPAARTEPGVAAKTLPKLAKAEEAAEPKQGLLARLGRLVPGRRAQGEDDRPELIVEPVQAAVPGDDFSDLSERPGLAARAGGALSRLAVRLFTRLRSRLAEFEPTKKQGFFVMFVAVMVWRPWLIPGLLLLTFLALLIAYFSLGPDRVSELAQTNWERFAKRYPERAAVWLARIQHWADRVDSWLGRLPESWTDGIYMPDLGRSVVDDNPVDGKDDPFERLAADRDTVIGPPGQVSL